MTEPILELAEHLKRVMIDETSLESEEHELWTKENFSALYEATHKNLLEDSAGDEKPGFIKKLAEQIEDAPKHVAGLKPNSEAHKALIPLSCEVLGVYYAYPSNISSRSKLGNIDGLLASECAVIQDSEYSGSMFPRITAAFEQKGVGSGGMGFNTNRQIEIFFLIEFFKSWYEQDVEQRTRLLEIENRVLFQNFIDELADTRSPQSRHLLLFYLDQDYYPPIISTRQKNSITDVFDGFLTEQALAEEWADAKPVWDIDQRIHVISIALESLTSKKIDFYSSELEPFWNSATNSEFLDVDPELLAYKKQIILFGPPGTGKTFTAGKLAEQMIRYDLAKKLGIEIFKAEGKAMQDESLSKNIHPLQLHPSYSYEDFIHGLQIKDGDTKYVDGYLLMLIATMNENPTLPHVLILDEINRIDLSRLFGECFSALENRGEPIKLMGGENKTLCIPSNLYLIGTMNLIDHSVEQLDFALRRRFLWVETTYSGESLLEICRHDWAKLDWANSREFTWDDMELDFNRLVEAADNLNEAICNEQELGRDYMIGHTFFKDTIKFAQRFLRSRVNKTGYYIFTKAGKPQDAVQRLWRLSLSPLLSEYLAGIESTEKEAVLKRLKGAFVPSKTA